MIFTTTSAAWGQQAHDITEAIILAWRHDAGPANQTGEKRATSPATHLSPKPGTLGPTTKDGPA